MGRVWFCLMWTSCKSLEEHFMSKGYFNMLLWFGDPKKVHASWFQRLWLIDLSIKFTQMFISKRFLFCFLTPPSTKKTHTYSERLLTGTLSTGLFGKKHIRMDRKPFVKCLAVFLSWKNAVEQWKKGPWLFRIYRGLCNPVLRWIDLQHDKPLSGIPIKQHV